MIKTFSFIVCLVTTCNSHEQWSLQYSYTQSHSWYRLDGPSSQDQVFKVIQDYEDRSKLGHVYQPWQNSRPQYQQLNHWNHQFSGNFGDQRQEYQPWLNWGPTNQQLNQGNKQSPGYIENPEIQEFNLPGAVRNEVNEEASNREAAANQDPLQGRPPCNATTETKNPCTRKIVVPNFRKPGRRLSEIKCLEYIWDIKNEEEERTKEVYCSSYKIRCLNFTGQGGYIRGRYTKEGEFPHMGALGWRATAGGWMFKCGSSMISPKFMVSAAHCTKSRKDSKIANTVPEIVRIGAKNLVIEPDSFYPKDFEIANIIRQSPKQYFDIALIELKQNLKFDQRIRPACLWSRFNTNTVDSSVTGSGWGVTEIGGKETTTELRAGDLDIINNNECDPLLRHMCNRLWCGLQEHQMCAGKLDGSVDACQGDSGGPLQAKINLHSSINGRMYYLLGVTSFGFGCARANTPGVFTRISSYVNWIEPIVWPNETA